MSYGVEYKYFRQLGGDLLLKEMAIIFLETDLDQQIYYSKLLIIGVISQKNIGVKISIFNVICMVYLGIQNFTTTIKNWVHLSAKRSKIHMIFTLLAMRKKKFMERFNINIYDITDLGYLQVDKSKVVHFCPNHDFSYKIQCATRNVKMMKKFMNTQKEWENVVIWWECARNNS